MKRIRVLPRNCEKSTIVSARSAGASNRECWSTLPTSNRVASVIHVVGWAGTTTGLGTNPPSEPMKIQLGPLGLQVVSGVGETTGSVWAASSSAGLSATSLRVPVRGSATYQDRFQKRSLAAFRTRIR